MSRATSYAGYFRGGRGHAVLDRPTAIKVYQQQGTLTIVEILRLHNLSKRSRNMYFTSIYGYSAGMIAREVYKTWVREGNIVTPQS